MEVGLGWIDKKRGRWWCSPRKGIGSAVSVGFRRGRWRTDGQRWTNGRGASWGGWRLTLRNLGTHGCLEQRGGHDGDWLPLNAVAAGKAGGTGPCAAHAVGGGEGPVRWPQQQKASTNPGAAGAGGTRCSFKTGEGVNRRSNSKQFKLIQTILKLFKLWPIQKWHFWAQKILNKIWFWSFWRVKQLSP
jgi:hypothetical protein